nr:helix-turn-helix transcriptional regulator [Nocardia carnea]
MDASHFSRRFRSVLGCTPTDWRAQHRDDLPGSGGSGAAV